MTYQNPFPFSNDNKRYHTWNYYLKKNYHTKVFKVPLNASFTCPNRDGTCGYNGCTFCGIMGSGEFVEDATIDLEKQFIEGKQRMQEKWPNGKAIAYFQAFTNTYAPLEVLQKTFQPFVERDDVIAISIATRADCLEDDKIAYLQSLTTKKNIWIELGLQSIHDKTALRCNRGHNYAQFIDCIERLSKTDLKIAVHLINSLPDETADEMIESARIVGKLPIHAVKIHMLHLMKQTQMEKEYQEHPFPILTKDDYIDIVIRQLEVLPPDIIIQRLTGDGIKEDLIAPLWTLKKVVVLNDIDKEMVRRNTWQGQCY